MKLKTLIHEPTYDSILDTLIDVSQKNLCSFISPTPLISPFWETTFTPSSSEVIFRSLLDTKPNAIKKFYTIQPCIRINDLPNLVDGWHSLLFHMASFFFLDIDGFECFLSCVLNSMIEASNLKLSDFYFTISPNSYCPNSLPSENLGSDLLKRLNVKEEQIIWCSGTDNYQDSYRISEKRQRVSMIGPKVEIYVMLPNGSKLYEIATCEIANCSLEFIREGEKIQRNVFAFALGLERFTSVMNGQTSISLMSQHRQLINEVCNSCLHQSMANSSLGKDAISQVLFIIDALVAISPEMASNKPHNRGITNHYRRMIRELSRTLKGMGISLENLLQVASSKLGQDVGSELDVDFIAEQIKEEVMGLV